MDNLDKVILSARKAYDETERKLTMVRSELASIELEEKVQKARLEALLFADSVRPSRVNSSEQPSRGRQPGSISRVWRAVLARIVLEHPEGASDEEVANIARSTHPMLANTRVKDARERMESYQFHDFVRPTERGWQVTPGAMSRFELERIDASEVSLETAEGGAAS